MTLCGQVLESAVELAREAAAGPGLEQGTGRGADVWVGSVMEDIPALSFGTYQVGRGERSAGTSRQ